MQTGNAAALSTMAILSPIYTTEKMGPDPKKVGMFTQHFRKAKGVRTHFFRFWDHRPQNQNLDPLHANMERKVYTAKISGPYQLFWGPDPFFTVV